MSAPVLNARSMICGAECPAKQVPLFIISWVRKLKLKEAKRLTHSHTEIQWQRARTVLGGPFVPSGQGPQRN